MIEVKYLTTEDLVDINDEFAGIRFQDGNPTVVFPRGFSISSDEKERRRDVFRLLYALKKFSEHREGDDTEDCDDSIAALPLASYQYIIQDFLSNGYYQEKEIRFVEGTRGKIDWKRTIQKEQFYIDASNVVFLKYQIRTNRIKNDALVTLIHQYCVYKSFNLLGWLYLSSDKQIQKPILDINETNKGKYIAVLVDYLNKTFNDKKRKLFQSMIDILKNGYAEKSLKEGSIGVNKFHTVWENMIDYVYGEKNKERFFPYGYWHIPGGKKAPTPPLLPDTVLLRNNTAYILDAKYYKYGITRLLKDLPSTDSLQKQITYAKKMDLNRATYEIKDVNHIYNAFILPFDAKGGDRLQFVSVGTVDWEEYNTSTPNYKFILGILADTKQLISTCTEHDEQARQEMSNLIEQSLKNYRLANHI